ncbi:MAG: HEAT repeat domain-containing protein [Planctomycetaceae bacterium]|nr:HEAT repeat domain-containing protein [Planctomycetaceae bacterium]
MPASSYNRLGIALFAIVAWSNLVTVTWGQFVDLPSPPQVVSVDVVDEDDEITAAAFVDKLKNREPRPRVDMTAPVVVWPESIGLQTAEAYGPAPLRFLAARLIIANTTDQEVTVDLGKVELECGQKKLQCGDLPERFPNYYIELDDEVLDVQQIRKRKPVQVAPGTIRHVSILFAPIPDFPIDIDLALHVPLGEKVATVDLRACSSNRLQLEVTRLGPEGALGWLHIRGHLDSVNCADLATQMTAWNEAGVERFVISWDEKAVPFSETLFDWLVETMDEDTDPNPLFVHLPRLHVGRLLYLAAVPSLPNEDVLPQELLDIPFRQGVIPFQQSGYIDPAALRIMYPSVKEAVASALEDVFLVASPSVVRQELRFGHDYSKIALLRTVANQLQSEDFDTVVQLSEADDPEMRSAAIEALGQFDSAAALSRIQQNLQSDDPQVRAAATTAIMRSPHGRIQVLVDDVIANPPVSRPQLVKLLVRYPHPKGVGLVEECLTDEDAALRVVALHALSVLGHPQLIPLIEDRLNDSDEKVRKVAFTLLSQRPEREAEEASLSYAKTLLNSGELDETLVAFLQRVRNPDFAPLLVKRLDTENVEEQIMVISLLGQTGDLETNEILARRFKDFELEAKQAVLSALQEQHSPVARELAVANINNQESTLRGMSLNILVAEGGPEVEPIILKQLKAIQNSNDPPDSEYVNPLVDAIARLNGSKSKKALAEFRDHCFAHQFEECLASTLDALQLQMQLSPGWNAAQTGLYHWRQNSNENAIRYFELATHIDPELGFAYSVLGNIYLKQDDLEKSLESFQRGYELNPFDGQAVTGIGIVEARQGKPEEAVEFTLAAADRFKEDDIFAYNTACVYGRAVENLRTQPESPRRDELIDKYTQGALKDLDRSIELGFADVELMRDDPDLHALREAPGFEVLVQKLMSQQ